jgi:outer membrane protein OmpA-like peptidoglycan-associated protein
MTERSARFIRAVGIALLPALLAACAPTTTIVLLPEEDGRKTAVTVKQGDKQVVLERPYAAAKTGATGPAAYQSKAEEVQQLAGPAREALPARATKFTLYFVEGKEEFTDDSKREVDGIFSEIAKRPVPDIVVVGHTDRLGSDPDNDALGQRRANRVKDDLMARGIAAENIEAISRGRRDPAVPTADGVVEPRNRRVEILVR